MGFQILDCKTYQDVGRSVNPAIDFGQIEGGLFMGASWLTQEELKFDDKTGKLLGNAEEYDIGGPQNFPLNYGATILPGCDNPHAVYSSKGIGEPPHNLASAVGCALKQAIAAARLQINLPPCTQAFKTPINREQIRLLCGNQLTPSK